MIFKIYFESSQKLSSGIGLLVVHQMYKEENSHIRPFIVIGNFKQYYCLHLCFHRSFKLQLVIRQEC